jgi:hypothetical protein
VDVHGDPTDYEQLVAWVSRVDRLLRELESWLHARERTAAAAADREREHEWRSRRLAILRQSRALLAALLLDVEL